jgi:hypothetical protein
MAKKRSAIPWVIVLFIAIFIWAILADYSSKKPLIFWPIFIGIIGGMGYILYRLPTFRSKVWDATKFAVKDLSLGTTNYKEDSPKRTPIPMWMKKVVETRANAKCENPSCEDHSKSSPTLFPWYHHIDGDNTHHDVRNLAFFCAKCAQLADHHAVKEETVRRWTNANYRNRKSEVDAMRRELGY